MKLSIFREYRKRIKEARFKLWDELLNTKCEFNCDNCTFKHDCLNTKDNKDN